MKEKKKKVLGLYKNGFYRIISGNVLAQLMSVGFVFLIVFFIILLIYKTDSDTLFKEMTDYDPKNSNQNHPLKLFYLLGVVFFSGLLVMVLTNGIRNLIEKIQAGDIRYYFKEHVVIFGYNEIAKGVIKNLCMKPEHPKIVVVVENNIRSIREEMIGLFGTQSEIYFQHGCRINNSDLETFNLHLAIEIFIIGENESNADIMNLDCYTRISQMNDFQIWPAYLYLYLQEPSSITLVNNRSYKNTIFNVFDLNHRLRVYNTDERWARRILVDSLNEWPESNLNMRKGRRITMDSEDYVHLVIFGMSNTGEIVAKTAAQTCHHPNFITRGIRTKITVIDGDFNHNRGILHGRYFDYLQMCRYTIRRVVNGKNEVICDYLPPKSMDYLDIEWEFIESAPDETLLQLELAKRCENIDELLTVVVCNSDEKENLNIALGLPKAYYDNSVPVWLYANTDSLNKYLIQSRYDNIIPWGMQSNRPTQELWEESAAKKLNYFYSCFDYVNCRGIGIDDPLSSKIDELWENSSVDVRMNSITAMAGVPSLVGSMKNWSIDTNEVTIDDEELEVFAKLEHIRWSTCMLLNGYRPLTEQQRTAYDTSENQHNRRTLRRSLQKNFYHPDLTQYNNLDYSAQQIDRETIKFYISSVNR